MTVKAIDISAWQGKISTDTFIKVKNQAGIPAVILRSSYTTQSRFQLYRDKVFEANIKAAYKAGLRIGIYHYSQAISETEAVKEAEFVLQVIRPYKSWISLPIAFDWEFGGRLSGAVARKLGKQRCRQICDAFCRTIRQGGYEPMVYANLSTLNGYIATDIYKDWKIWCAQYHSRCDYKHPLYMWQYSNSGRIPGIPGRIDMNLLYDKSEPASRAAYPGSLPMLPKRGWFSSGDKGEQVKRLQKFLNWYGGYGLDVDGEIGRLTISAVRQYQGREKLTVDGAFGQESLKRARTVRR